MSNGTSPLETAVSCLLRGVENRCCNVPDQESLHKALTSLSGVDADAVLSALADVLVLVAKDGSVIAAKSKVDYYGRPLGDVWAGHRFVESLAADSMQKGLDLVGGDPDQERLIQVNHVIEGNKHWPVAYFARQVPEGRQILLLGHDMEPISTLQQQLIRFQASMEQDYAKLRSLESRYRIIFETTSSPILLVDASTLKIMEANSAAASLAKGGIKRLVGRNLVDIVVGEDAGTFVDKISAARATGQQQQLTIDLSQTTASHKVSICPFRQDDRGLLLVRISAEQTLEGAESKTNGTLGLVELIDRSPDGFVVTDLDGRIAMVNQAFLSLADLASTEQAIGKSLSNWLGRPGIDLEVVLTQLRNHGVVRLYPTTLKSAYGATIDVELAANAESTEGNRHYAFALRDVHNRLQDEGGVAGLLPHSAGQLSELIGRVPLRDLVRQTTDVIERLCIEAALELTDENRASAAELLGLSRQGFYMKLRRYGLIDSSKDEVEQN